MSVDKSFYLNATVEIESNNKDRALWAKCIALCRGDEVQAKYAYIEARAAELAAEEIVDVLPNADAGISPPNNSRSDQAEASLDSIGSLELGDHINSQLVKDIESLQSRANQGEASAQVSLADMYYLGEGLPLNYLEAMKWYRLAAEQGEPSAQISLADMYYLGQGMQQDYAEARKWYQCIAENDVSNDEELDAVLMLASMCYLGEGGPQNYEEAMKWYRLAAENGDSDSMMLMVEYSCENNLDEDAIKWYELASDAGEPEAELWMANRIYCEYLASGGDPNAEIYSDTFVHDYLLQDAVDLYESAAQGGMLEAQMWVAEEWFRREYYEEAIQWYRAAAEQGEPQAQYCLGIMLIEGMGEPKNCAEACTWLRLAQAGGHENAAHPLEIAESRANAIAVTETQELQNVIKRYHEIISRKS